VKPPPFDYHAPTSVDDAVAVLAEVGHVGKVLAGGQSLIPILNMRLASPAHLVDINRVAGLDDVQVTPAGVRVGALVRHSALERHEQAWAVIPLLRQGLITVAHPVIRNRGTTLGSIVHADPSGEMPAVLMLTGGWVEAVSVRGVRRIPAQEFFLGPLECALAEDELATAVHFDALPAGTGTAFEEITRRHGDYALAGVAATVVVADGVITAARVGVSSLSPTPAVLDLGEALAGHPVEDADWAGAAERVRTWVDPDGDIHADADYRRVLAGVLTERVLAAAARSATGTGTDQQEAR